jgi:hypothetical protein
MPTSDRVLNFRKPSDVPRPKAAKARLRADVQRSIARSIEKLPILGRLNPSGALLIERTINDWMPPTSNGGVGRDATTSALRGAADRRRRSRATLAAITDAIVRINHVLKASSQRR